MHRHLALSAVLAAALIPAGGSSRVRAAGITYQLTNKTPAGTTPVDKVIANVNPPGVIDENTGKVSPLTILPGSKGFDQTQLGVSIGDGVVPQGQPGAGSPLQALALTFSNGGFAPGGVLDFSLKLNSPSANAPQLELPPTATGLELIQVVPPKTLTPTTESVTPATSSVTNTPEPLSLLLWSTLAGAGVLRARRKRQPALAQA